MPQVKGGSSASGVRRRTDPDISIRIDNSAVKLENKRLKVSVSNEVERLHGLQLRKRADRSFDIKMAQKEADMIFNQAKLVRSTQGLWEEILHNRKVEPTTTSQTRAKSAMPRVNSTGMSPPGGTRPTTSTTHGVSWAPTPTHEETAATASRKNGREMLPPPPSSSSTSFKVILAEHHVQPVDVKSAPPPPQAAALNSSHLPFDSEEDNDDDENDEEVLFSPSRLGIVNYRLRPVSAFLPIDQIPIGGKLEVPRGIRRMTQSAHPGHRESSAAMLEKDKKAMLAKRSQSAAGRSRKEGKKVRSFQHLKELAHIDNISRAQYSEKHNLRLLERARKQEEEEKRLRERIQSFYRQLDIFVKSTKDALRGGSGGGSVDTRRPTSSV